MADFCKECSIAMFGEDFGELAQSMPEDKFDEDHGALVLCECCGPIVVDFNGKRMSKDFFPSCDCADHQPTPAERLT